MFVNWRNMIDLDVPSALPSFLTFCISSFINVSQCSGLCIFDSISDEPIRSPLIAHLSRDIFFLCRALLLQSDEWRCMDVSSANTYVSTNADLDIVFIHSICHWQTTVWILRLFLPYSLLFQRRCEKLPRHQFPTQKSGVQGNRRWVLNKDMFCRWLLLLWLWLW